MSASWHRHGRQRHQVWRDESRRRPDPTFRARETPQPHTRRAAENDQPDSRRHRSGADRTGSQVGTGGRYFGHRALPLFGRRGHSRSVQSRNPPRPSKSGKCRSANCWQQPSKRRPAASSPRLRATTPNAAGQDDDFIRYGLSNAPRTSIFITTGTGLGGCVITDGNIFYGRGQAGELGHLKIAIPAAYANRFSADPNPACGCGGFQCVESRASLTGLIRRISWALSEPGTALIRSELEADGKEFKSPKS